jgi:Potassium-transporting ATPase A subunit
MLDGLVTVINRSPKIVPMPVAAAPATKRAVSPSPSTFPSYRGLLVGFLVGGVLVIGGLTFFPTLALCSVAGHLTLRYGLFVGLLVRVRAHRRGARVRARGHPRAGGRQLGDSRRYSLLTGTDIMKPKTASQMRMRTAALLGGQLWRPDLHDSSENDAGRGCRNGGVKVSSIRAGDRSSDPEAVPARRAAIGRSVIAPKESAYLIEIFGMSAGILIMNGTRFAFHAAHRAFRELDGSCFSSAARAERAAHLSWMRFQHRSRPGIRSGRSR